MNIPITVIDPQSLALYELNGNLYSGQQLQAALRVCFDMAVSYAMAEPRNGGNEHIEWEWLDEVAELADEVMADRMDEVTQEARDNNEYVEETEREGEED
jgi:hypothetical protein